MSTTDASRTEASQPPRRFVAIHEVATDDYAVRRMKSVDDRTALPTDGDADVWVEEGGYISVDDVVLVDPVLVEALVDLPVLERTAGGWFAPPPVEPTSTPRMYITGAADEVEDEHLLSDIRTLAAVYLARKGAAQRPTSPAHEAFERVVRGGASKEDGNLVRAALDRAAGA